MNRQWRQARQFIGAALVASTLYAGTACAGMRGADFDHQVYKVKGVCTIRFGSAGVDWWLLQAGVSSIDLTPDAGVNLQSAEMRIFEDVNGNGAFDNGERQLSFQSTSGPNGLSINNVQVSAGDVAGWNTDNVQCSIQVIQANGTKSVWTHAI